MASKRKGTVSKIGKNKYSFYLLLDEDNFYFNTKFDPKCGVGDVVGITFDKKADNRGQVKDIKLLEDNGGPKGFQESSGGGYSGGKGGGYKADPDRQASIVYQSSRKDALHLAEIIVSNEAIKLPKDADKRRTIIEALVDETTLAYFKAAINPSEAMKSEEDVEADASVEDWDEGGDDSDEFDDQWD